MEDDAVAKAAAIEEAARAAQEIATLDVLVSQAGDEAKSEESRLSNADAALSGILTLGLVIAGFVAAMVRDADLIDEDTRNLYLGMGLLLSGILIVLGARVAVGPVYLRSEKHKAERSAKDEVSKSLDGKTHAQVRKEILTLWRARSARLEREATWKLRCAAAALLLFGGAGGFFALLSTRLAGTL